MFIDEVGHADMKSALDVNQRYLSLTGIICQLDHYRKVACPKLDAFKTSHIGSTSVILHRTDIVNRRKAFACLHDDSAREKLEIIPLTQTSSECTMDYVTAGLFEFCLY